MLCTMCNAVQGKSSAGTESKHEIRGDRRAGKQRAVQQRNRRKARDATDSWLQVLSFLLTLEEKQCHPKFSPVDEQLLFPVEPRHTAGRSRAAQRSSRTALGALIWGWERRSHESSDTTEPSLGHCQKEKLQHRTLRPGI